MPKHKTLIRMAINFILSIIMITGILLFLDSDFVRYYHHPKGYRPQEVDLEIVHEFKHSYNLDIRVEKQNLLYDKFKDAVFAIYCYDKECYFAAGFIIDSSGIAMTAAHVICSREQVCKNSDRLWARFADDSWSEITAIYAYDRRGDTAVIKLQNKLEPYPFLEIEDDFRNINAGDMVYLISNLHNRHNAFDYGMLRQKDYSSFPYAGYENYTLEIMMYFGPGHSGSPIISESGKVVGITSLGSENVHLSFDIHQSSAVDLTVFNIKTAFELEPFCITTCLDDISIPLTLRK